MNTQDATTRIATHFEDFNRNLKVGSTVEVRWTNSHRYFAARGKVSKLNDKSLKVKLLEAVPGLDGAANHGVGYPVGHRITVPRMYGPRWSGNNGAFPLPPLQGILIDAAGARVRRPLRSDSSICSLLDCEAIVPNEFYVSSQPVLLKGTQFVALQDAGWTWKQLPIYEPSVPLRGNLFIVRVPLAVGGYWQSLSSTDIAAFARLFGVDVRDEAGHEAGVPS